MIGKPDQTAEMEVIWRANADLPNVGDPALFGTNDPWETVEYEGEIVSVDTATRRVVVRGRRADLTPSAHTGNIPNRP